jgi:apolipoprotein N-acyltransferase
MKGNIPNAGVLPARRLTRVRTYALALLAGVAFASAGPPLDLYPAVWVGMAALAWLLEGGSPTPPLASRVRLGSTGALRGLAFGVGANLVLMRFLPATIARFTPLPWVAGVLGLVLLAAFEGLRWAVAGVACETLARARVPRPLAFAAGVYLGMFVPTMMPWTPTSAVSPWPVLVQLADVVGDRGVAAILALAAALVASGLRSAIGVQVAHRDSCSAVVAGSTRRRGLAMLGGAVAVVAAQVAAGVVRVSSVERDRAAAPHASVALLQPSIGPTTRWDEARAPSLLEGLQTLTRRAATRGADLVVWPETAYPFPLPHGTRVLYDATRAVVPSGVRTPVLTGALLPGAPDGAAYNSAILATSDGALSDSYDKRHLLWFGETVPLADRLPWMRRVFARGLGLAAGDHEVALETGKVRAAVLICYEDMLPEAGREAMEVDPNLLVNITNDAWFEGSFESEQHLRVAALRAVEVRRDLVRAVNLGQTSHVDAAGRVVARAPSMLPAPLLTEPALLSGSLTPYARFGDAPWALLVLVLANVAVWRAVRALPKVAPASK